MEEKSIALEMLEEVKKSNKRWFFISIILLLALIISNVGWLLYESGFEYVEETQTVESSDINASNITQY